MKNIGFISILGIVVLLSSCASVQQPRNKQYSKMYEEKPVSIVIMPPINQTNSAEAKDFFYTTLYMPLCEKGYYVFSPYLTMDLFQSESAYDSELFLDSDLQTFKNVLGADAAMFTIIKSWSRNNVFGQITVGIEYVLRSTESGESLYHREGLITISLSQNSGNSSLLGMAIDLATTVVSTATTDKVEAGRVCNTYVLNDMPVGKYDENYLKDGDIIAGKPYIKVTVNK